MIYPEPLANSNCRHWKGIIVVDHPTVLPAEPIRPWPIHGLAYVVAFMGPLSAGPLLGVAVAHWGAGLIGFALGAAIDLLNAWAVDRYFEPFIRRHYELFLKPGPRRLLNIIAFAWAFFLCVLAMLSPLVVFDLATLTR